MFFYKKSEKYLFILLFLSLLQNSILIFYRLGVVFQDFPNISILNFSLFSLYDTFILALGFSYLIYTYIKKSFNLSRLFFFYVTTGLVALLSFIIDAIFMVFKGGV